MDETSVMRHCDAMMDAEIIAVDTETTGLFVNDGRDYCMGISVAYRLGILGVVSAYFPFRHEGAGNLDSDYLAPLKRVLESKPIVCHGLKFDLASLATIGINPTENLTFCTINLAHMSNEELFSKELDYLAKKFLGKGKEKGTTLDGWINLYGWRSVPAGLMAPYACIDAERCLGLFEFFWKDLKEQELVQLWPIERRFCRLLGAIEARGVAVNRDFCQAKSDAGRDRMASIASELGYDVIGPLALYELLIVKLGLPVLATSAKTNKPSFTKKEMATYDEMLQEARFTEDQAKVAQLILEYRGWQKAVTSLYEPMLNLVSPDGRVRANFKQHGTVTGRLACAKPNLQQIPRESVKVWNGDAKRSFLAKPGYTLYGYDYSQLEFRLAAAYGREKWLLDAFDDPDGDVFTVMSEKLGHPRQVIKTRVYATLYGAGEEKVATTLGVSVAEAHEDHVAFKESIKNILDVSKVATARAKQRGFVRYWTGRKRHLVDGEHRAFNSMLQGGGAELVKRAMIAIDDDTENIPHDVCQMVLQVHDEIVFEIKDGYREQVEPFIIAHMTAFPDFGVTLKVEGKVWNK